MLPVEDKNHAQRNLKLELNINENNVNLNPSNSSINGQNNSATSTTKQIIHFDQKVTVLKKSELQRPKSLVKESNSQQKISMETINSTANEAAEATTSTTITSTSGGAGSILITGPSTVGATEDGKKIKMSKIGNTKNVALKR